MINRFKSADALLKMQEKQIYYITPPRRDLFKLSSIYNANLFFLYLLSVNFYVVMLLIPIYIILLHYYHVFLNICEKYRYKKLVLVPLIVIFNVLSCIAAIFLRTVLLNILGW